MYLLFRRGPKEESPCAVHREGEGEAGLKGYCRRRGMVNGGRSEGAATRLLHIADTRLSSCIKVNWWTKYIVDA